MSRSRVNAAAAPRLVRVSDNQLLPVFGAASAVGYLASLRYEQNDLGEALRLIDLGLSPTQRAINSDSRWSLLRYRAQFAWASSDDAGAHESLQQLDAVVARKINPYRSFSRRSYTSATTSRAATLSARTKKPKNS